MMVRQLIATAWLCALVLTGSAQQPQTARIPQGGSVTLRANSQYARSYLWFRNGEPLNGHHDQRLVISEAGTYTVMALGDHCNSDLSEPVEVIVDTDAEPATVDMQIRNEPDQPAVLIGSVFTYQLVVVNNGPHTVTDVSVKAVLPIHVAYQNVLGAPVGEINYSPSSRELTWLIRNMAPGESATLTFSARAESEGTATQLATVTSNLTERNAANNEATATVKIIALNAPNTFTPNGDGRNDFFVIEGLERFPQNRIVLFNRWGNEIYKRTGYRNDWNAAGLAEGTYYYVLELQLYTGQWQTVKGFVTVIRNTQK